MLLYFLKNLLLPLKGVMRFRKVFRLVQHKRLPERGARSFHASLQGFYWALEEFARF